MFALLDCKATSTFCGGLLEWTEQVIVIWYVNIGVGRKVEGHFRTWRRNKRNEDGHVCSPTVSSAALLHTQDNDLESTSLMRGDTSMARVGLGLTADSTRSTSTRRTATLVGTALLMVGMLVGAATSLTSTPLLLDNFDPGKTSAKFDKFDRYVMPDFDEKKPFASFLASVGGMWGMLAWSFYVNRGQGMSVYGQALDETTRKECIRKVHAEDSGGETFLHWA